MKTQAQICQDVGSPGCLREPDPAFEMRFDDIGEAPLQFCTACGPRAHAMNAAIMKALRADPTFAQRFESQIEKAEARREANAS